VGRSRAVDDFEKLELYRLAEMLEQTNALTEQDRSDMQPELVDAARSIPWRATLAAERPTVHSPAAAGAWRIVARPAMKPSSDIERSTTTVAVVDATLPSPSTEVPLSGRTVDRWQPVR
jgi:hypothetical protein